MSRYEHGRVLAVNETRLGSELVSAHAAGITSLTVEDPVDFDEDGGWLKIADQVVEYTSCDDDTGEITLAGTLDAAASEGEWVHLWDQLRQVATVDKIAYVELDGDDDNTDPLEATIPLHLLDDLAEGIRGNNGESVLLEQDGDEWRIVDVLGLAAQGASGAQFWNDLHTVATTGQQTIALTHEPIEHSEHLYWNGLYQPASVWSRNGQTITVPDSSGHLLTGDELTVEYAYRVGVAAESLIVVDWQASGWKYLQVADADTTNRAGVGFDDSGWSSGAAAFGHIATFQGVTYPNPQTQWDVLTALWVRRGIAVVAGTPLEINVRVEADVDVYWNGAQVGYVGDPAGNQVRTGTVTIPGGDVTGADVLAFRTADNGEPVSSGGSTYFDAQVVKA